MRRLPRCHSRRDTQDLPISHLRVQQLLSPWSQGRVHQIPRRPAGPAGARHAQQGTEAGPHDWRHPPT
ncbi:hypothetical protein HaLaN_11182 [Haematococcus lacustris]|uniref:Uncharacterized protein n=1 Tax=Haematococcus lacustris TaxID=44745 RepID=A0A699Z786_HAELA|nr:hypothetical protein HaLaN_11182 [Haematococcus lacustris]